jgi:hypothetical protein
MSHDRDDRPSAAPAPEPARQAPQPRRDDAPEVEPLPEPDAENLIPVKHGPGTL